MKKKQEPDEITLATLCGGAVEERFQEVLDKVKVNLDDPNTLATATRKVTITLSISQDESREFSSIEATVAAKLAPAKPLQVAVSQHQTASGRYLMRERQRRLEFDDQQAIQ